MTMSGPSFINNRYFPRAQPGGGAGTSPWTEAGGQVYTDNLAWDVIIGANVTVGGERLRVVGDSRMEGNLVITGFIDPSLRLEDGSGGNAAFLEFDDGQSAGLSALGEARIRFNAATNQTEVSQNGGAYTPIFTPSGGGWTDDGTIVRLTTSTDDVTIGSAVQAGTERLRVTGGATLLDGTSGAVPVGGAGTRMMWAPAKAALRAGAVTGTQWDNANVGSQSVAFGADTTASGAQSTALGDDTEAPAAHSFSIGEESQAARIGQLAQANGQVSARGDSQRSTIVARRQTLDATPIPATLDGAAPAGVAVNTSNRIILEDDTSYTFEALVVARNTVASESKMWRLTVGIKRDVGAGTVALVGMQTKSVIGRTLPGAATWDANFVADAVNGAIVAECTGQAGKTINWSWDVRFVEVAV